VKLSNVLKELSSLYIETSPIIYFVEENPTYIDRMDTIMNAAANGDIQAISSTLILTEVLVHPLREENDKLIQSYRTVLVKSKDFQLVPITTSVAEIAADLRARYNLRTPDALHVATAIDAGCDAFLTNDLGLKRVKELMILVLDELELPEDN
jgi:predicted nucleic acid-binding protein